MANQYRLGMAGVSKIFPGVKALDDINLKVRPGTVHALMGENGVGKSILMKCLFGIYKMDEGQTFVNGEKVEIMNPDDALHKGLAMMYQELQLIPECSIAENVYLGRYPTKGIGPFKMVDHEVMNSEAEKWLKDVEMSLNPKAKLGTLSIGQMQSVEIAKTVSQSAKLVTLDELTSSLTDNEVEALFRVVRGLKTRGVSMIHISHKTVEIRQIADDITIMRGGTCVGSWEVKDISDDGIVKQTAGCELINAYPPKDDYRTEETVLKVDHLCNIHERSFQDCSSELRRGEILGFGGLVGAQRTESMEAIFGMRHIASGQIEILGRKAAIRRSQDAIHDSVGMITEDRRGAGIIGCLSIEDNTVIASYNNYTHLGKTDKKKVDEVVKDSIAKLSTRTPSGKILIQSSSGGNQQKVTIARWLANNPDILIVNEPTKGTDVDVKYEIYQIMTDLMKQRKSIIMISSEMPELIGMSNRTIAMCNDHITGELEGGKATQERIMSYATQLDLQSKLKNDSKQKVQVMTVKKLNIADFLINNGIIMVLIILAIVTGILRPTFFSTGSANNIALNVAPHLVIACGVPGCLITEGTDLPAGRMVGLSTCTADTLLQKPDYNGKFWENPSDFGTWWVLVVLLICIAVRGIFGCINGLVVPLLQVPAFIGTLGVQLIVYGVCLVYMDATPIGGYRAAYTEAAKGKFFGVIPYLPIIVLMVGTMTRFIYNKTPHGKYMYAIGDNEQVAGVSGVSTKRIKIVIYITAAALYALGDFLVGTKSGGSSVNTGQGWELETIVACTIGGASVSGGIGHAPGVPIGVLVFEILKTCPQYLGVDTNYRYIAQGIVTVVATALDIRKYIAKE